MTLEPSYSILARYYDQMFAEHLKIMSRGRRRLLRPVLPAVRSACDLACGPGNTAMELAKRGLQVFAVDLSPEMCRITREKARKLALEVEVMEADMRSFRLPAPVDLVTCEFDAINHVPRRGDLARVARAVARALSPEGCFYFDVNTLRAFRELWPSSWYVELEGVKMVSHGGYDRKRKKGWAEFQWFVPQGNLYRHHSERYEEVCWSETEMENTLRAAGFNSIRRWDSSEVIPGPSWVRPGCRSFYLARKAVV